ncbi:MAG: twin-arginine translocase TatA/TatE family subunit [Anaerolineales bacterium]|jgi:TatA/E family protein of Tat protein translocase
MFGIQPIHILIILVVALLVFGASRLPEIGRGMGRAISEFRKGTKEMTENLVEEAKKSPDTAGPIPSPNPPASPTVKGNFCNQCGTANPPEARFCSNCGSQLPPKAG